MIEHIRINYKKYTEAFIALALLCCSGIIQFSYIWFRESLLVLAAILTILFLAQKPPIKIDSLKKLAILFLIIGVNAIVYSANLSGHIGLAVKLYIVMLASTMITKEKLIYYYRKYLLFFAVVSIVCFSIFVINPDFIVDRVPLVSYWTNETRYMLIYNFPGRWYQYSAIRNWGPFHEGGMYAIYLNLSILFILGEKELHVKDKIELGILIVALITTYSTAGFLVFLIIIATKVLSSLSRKEIPFIALLVGIMIIAELKLGIVRNKLTFSNASFTGRLAEVFIFQREFWKHPLLGIGYQNNSFLEGSSLKNASNGLLSLFLQFGVVGGLPYVVLYFSNLYKLQRNWILFIRNMIIVLIMWMVEPTIFQPLFLVVLFQENFSSDDRNVIWIDKFARNLQKKITGKITYVRNQRIARKLVETEQVNSDAEFPDGYVYVVRRYPGSGFFSDFFYVLSHMEYALDKWGNNTKIVVDMENYPTLYKESEGVDGITNQWEYYFTQPSGIGLGDLQRYGHVIWAENSFKAGDIPLYAGIDAPKVFPTKDIVSKLNNLYLNSINFTPAAWKYIQEGEDILNGKSVLGIHLRGTDMFTDPSHPNPFGLEDLIRFLKAEQLDTKYDCFFICSDTEEYVEKMQTEFPGRIVVLHALRATDNAQDGIHRQKNERYRNKYRMGLEVLKDMYWLSLCDGLICGHSNVSYAAIVFNKNRYEQVYVWNGSSYDSMIK